MHQGGIFAGHDLAVMQFQCCSAIDALVALALRLAVLSRLPGSLHHIALRGVNFRLADNLLHPHHGLFAAAPQVVISQAMEVAPGDFLGGRLPHSLVVDNASGYAVDAHVCRRLVFAFLAGNSGQDGFQQGESLQVAVVIDCRKTVRLIME